MEVHAFQTSDTPSTATQLSSSSSSSSTVPAPPKSIPPPLTRPAPNGSSNSLRTVYIKNLSPTVDSMFLKIACSPYGEVSNVKVIREADGVSKGFAFVTFKQAEQAEKAISMLNGKELDGRILFAGPAIKRASRHQHLHQQQQQQQFSRQQGSVQEDKYFPNGHHLQHTQNIPKFSAHQLESSRLNFKLGNVTSPQRKRRTVSETVPWGIAEGLVLNLNKHTNVTDTFSDHVTLDHQGHPLSPTRRRVLGETKQTSGGTGQVKKLPRSLSTLVFSSGQCTATAGAKSKKTLRHVDGSPCSAAQRRLLRPCNECGAPTSLVAEDIQVVDKTTCLPAVPQNLYFLPHIPPSKPTNLPQIPQSLPQLHPHPLHSQPLQHCKLQQPIDSGHDVSNVTRNPYCTPTTHPTLEIPQARHRVLPEINPGHTSCVSGRVFRPEQRLHQASRKRRRSHSLQPCPNGQLNIERHFTQENACVLSTEKTAIQPVQQYHSNTSRGSSLVPVHPMSFGKEILGGRSGKNGDVTGMLDIERVHGEFIQMSESKLQQNDSQKLSAPNSHHVLSNLARPFEVPYTEECFESAVKPNGDALYADLYGKAEIQESTLEQLQQPLHNPCAQVSEAWQNLQQKYMEVQWHEQALQNQSEVRESNFTTCVSLLEHVNVVNAHQVLDSGNVNVVHSDNPFYLHPSQLLNPSDQAIPYELQPLPSIDPNSNYISHQCHENLTCIPDSGQNIQSPLTPELFALKSFNNDPTTDFDQPIRSTLEETPQSTETIETHLYAVSDTDKLPGYPTEALFDPSSCALCEGEQGCSVCQDTAHTDSVLQQGINLYVKHLGEEVDDAGLKDMFSRFGEVLSAKVMMEGERSRGFGFVCFSKAEDAARATRDMRRNVDDVNKYNLYVAPAQRKEERQAFFREKLKARRRDVVRKSISSKDGVKTEGDQLTSAGQTAPMSDKSQDDLNSVLPLSTLKLLNLSEHIEGSISEEKITHQGLYEGKNKTALGSNCQGNRNLGMLFSKLKKTNFSHFDCFNVEKLRTPLIKPSKLIHGSVGDTLVAGKVTQRSKGSVCDESKNSLTSKDPTRSSPRQIGSNVETVSSVAGEEDSEFPQWGSPHDDSGDWPKFPSIPGDPVTCDPSAEDEASHKLTPIGCSMASSFIKNSDLQAARDSNVPLCISQSEVELSVTSILASSCLCSSENSPKAHRVAIDAQDTFGVEPLPDLECNKVSNVQSESSVDIEPMPSVVEAVCNVFMSSSFDDQVGSCPTGFSTPREAPAGTGSGLHSVDGTACPDTGCISETAEEFQTLRLPSNDHPVQDHSTADDVRLNLERSKECMKGEMDVFSESVQRCIDSLIGDAEQNCPWQAKRPLVETNSIPDEAAPKSTFVSSSLMGFSLEQMLSWPVESQKASLSWMVCTGIRDVLETADSRPRESQEMESTALSRLVGHGWTVDALVNSLVAMVMDLDVVEILNLLQTKDCLEVLVHQGLSQLWICMSDSPGSTSSCAAEAETNDTTFSEC